ncbi:probable arginine--tRNA ligase, mitochondrial [Biomphalaria glabrata]|uniref:Probable arginine--tRNA ligase, mitochondrial n=1 Tax=Biomphalaria glabrata TaxID=6526 RepID=A0A9W3AT94_BIOGL|nr:probable arginine--tRNA ligase, mitochondrial [Biomphalaria glabrata]
MASLYKNLIAKKLARTILSNYQHGGLQEIEAAIQSLVKVAPVRKEKIRDSQFTVSLSQLTKCLRGHIVNLDQIQTDGNLDVKIDHDLIHFKTEPAKLAQAVLQDVKVNHINYGYMGRTNGSQKHVCVEFSSPNVAKPFHVGHLRSTIIGNVISNFYEAAGHRVKRINWIGDWGTQFGLVSLGLMRFGDVELLKQDPLLELFNVYVKINQAVAAECGTNSESMSPTYQEGMALFSKLEKGDEHMMTIWRMIRDLSLQELNKMYQRLGVHFTHILSESEYHNRTQEILERLSQKDLLLYDSDGVGYVETEIKGVGRATVVKSDGSSLYLTRDIASALDRQEKFSFDHVHYVVEQGQKAHFIKLVSILQKLGVPWANSSIDDIHVRFGRVNGMSTREGNVVFLRDVLDEARTRVRDTMLKKTSTRASQDDMEKTADVIGVASIILQDLKANRVADYTFSWERMLNLKADSGVFVQYCHARLNSMMTNCGVQPSDDIDISCIVKDDALMNIVLHLARYPEVFEYSLDSLEPHHVVQYLFKLCHFINAAYTSCPVKGEPQDLAQARLFTFECAKQVLQNCLLLLGLKPLDVI